MLAAGVLGLSGLTLKRAAESGAGAVVTKSVGSVAREGYPNPTVVSVRCGLLNAIGLSNPGIDEFLKEVSVAKEGGVPVVVSIYGSSPEEFATLAGRCEEAGGDAVELNISCPHVEKFGMQVGQDPALVSKIVKRVKNRTRLPVFVKLTPNITDITEVAKAAADAGCDGITAINTIKALAVEIETFRPALGGVFGGLSGPAIKPVAVRCVYELYRVIRVPIIGVGGIEDWRDAVEFFLAGASAVQIGSALSTRGLGVFREVTRGVGRYLEDKEFRSVSEIVGLSHRCE
jgi:dihydroorotate dehydrogenase (NAD+) catalytic subunit